jgi:hypothetical protein
VKLEKDVIEDFGSSRCYVVADPLPMWFRAWYWPKDGSLQLTRSGMMTRQCVIRDAETQFGKTWKELSTKGDDNGRSGAVIRAIRGVITLSPKDAKFRST